MKTYMLARLQIRYGPDNLARYDDAMAGIRKLFEAQGVVLRHGMITRVGRLYEAWNLWETQDQGHIARALAAMSPDDPSFASVAALQQVVEHEDVRFVEGLPFAEG